MITLRDSWQFASLRGKFHAFPPSFQVMAAPVLKIFFPPRRSRAVEMSTFRAVLCLGRAKGRAAEDILGKPFSSLAFRQPGACPRPSKSGGRRGKLFWPWRRLRGLGEACQGDDRLAVHPCAGLSVTLRPLGAFCRASGSHNRPPVPPGCQVLWRLPISPYCTLVQPHCPVPCSACLGMPVDRSCGTGPRSQSRP